MRGSSRSVAIVSAALAGAVPIAACSLLTELDGFSTGTGADAGDASSRPSDAQPDGDGDGDGGTTDSGAASRYATEVASDGPLVYLRLGEAPGATVAGDATGHGNTGTLGKGHTLGAAGAIAGDPDTAIHFDGVHSGIDLGPKLDFVGMQPYSLEVWTKIDLVDSRYRHLFEKSDRTGADRQAYGLYVHDGALVFERVILGEQIYAEVASNPIRGRWAYVVATWDAARMRLFVDGIEVASNADVRGTTPSDAPFTIGCNEGFDQYVLSGDVDEVAIYDKALTAERIKAHYDVGRGAP